MQLMELLASARGAESYKAELQDPSGQAICGPAFPTCQLQGPREDVLTSAGAVFPVENSVQDIARKIIFFPFVFFLYGGVWSLCRHTRFVSQLNYRG